MIFIHFFIYIFEISSRFSAVLVIYWYLCCVSEKMPFGHPVKPTSSSCLLHLSIYKYITHLFCTLGIYLTGVAKLTAAWSRVPTNSRFKKTHFLPSCAERRLYLHFNTSWWFCRFSDWTAGEAVSSLLAIHSALSPHQHLHMEMQWFSTSLYRTGQ